MIGNKERIDKSGSGTRHAGASGTAERRIVFLTAGLVMTVLLVAAGLGCMRAYAGTSKENTRTVVITADSDDSFAAESAKLAKKSRGMMLQSTGKAKAYSSGRLIVCLEDGKSIDFSKYKATTVIKSNFGVCLVQFSSGNAARKAAKKIGALPGVSYVEPDDCSVNIGDAKVSHISLEGSRPEDNSEDMPDSDPAITPIGGESTQKTDLELSGDLVYESTVKAQAASASSKAMSWGAAYVQADKYAAFVKANTKRTVKVAVVDSGVSYHTKLKGRILTGRDYVDNDTNPSDKNGHGTHVAGVIVDCTPGINVKILPVRVMNASGNGSPSAVGNGIRYAVNKGAKVINLSLGAYQHYKYIEECITYANKKGATVVVAAGNESENTKYVCPAHMSAPIVVGAINANGKRAGFSNYGSSLDISAPGVNIRSCWLKGKYATASGTSMAVPHISAVAAMYRLMNPSANASRIQYLVRCYAKDLGAKGTDKYYGRGVPRMAGAITPSKVTLPRTALSMQVRKSVTLKAAITPYYAGKKKLTWTSSNKNVATVAGGKITAKSKGTTTITVKTVNGKKATCKVTVTAAAVKTAGVSKPKTGTKAPASQAAPAEPVRKEEAVPAAAAPEEVKIYIYPSGQTGNTPVQDGSIVAGSRLALDAEIVPAQNTAPALRWQSSDPAIASVDEKGIVTALAPGEVQITAMPVSAGDSSAEPDPAADTTAPTGAGVSGTYTLTVVRPDILTRHASYSAGEDREVDLEAVLRLPVPLDESAAEGTDRVNPAADYVLAILNKEDGDLTLLGAVNLGGNDSGSIHLHEGQNRERRTDLIKIRDASAEGLSDLSRGKQDSETGILCLRQLRADGCKTDVSLTADLDILRAAAGPGPARILELSDCLLAVYTDAAFEEREEAVGKEDTETIRRIDAEAVCTCSFSLSYAVPQKEGEEMSAPADSADTSTQAGTEAGDDKDEAKPTGAGGDDPGQGSDPAQEDGSAGGQDRTSEETPDGPADSAPDVKTQDVTEENNAQNDTENNTENSTDGRMQTPERESEKEKSRPANESGEESVQEETHSDGNEDKAPDPARESAAVTDTAQAAAE